MSKATLHIFKQILQHHVKEDSNSILTENLNTCNQSLLLHLLNHHRLEFAAYPIFKKNLPEDHLLLEKLRTACWAATQQFLEKQKLLTKLVQDFNQKNFQFVVLKGQPLNQLLYENQSVRQSNDIDILVHPNDLIHAHQYMLTEKFTLKSVITPEEWVNLPTDKQPLFKDFFYFDQTYKTRIELHQQATRIMGNWEQLATNIHYIKQGHAKQNTPILAPEENFLYLCLHGALDYWNRLQCLIDLALFYQKTPLDWERVISLAKKFELIRPLLELSLLLKQHFGLTLPPIKAASQWQKFNVRLHLIQVRRKWQRSLKYLAKKKTTTLLTDTLFNLCLCSTYQQKKAFLYGSILSWPVATKELLFHPHQPTIWLAFTAILNRYILGRKQTE